MDVEAEELEVVGERDALRTTVSSRPDAYRRSALLSLLYCLPIGIVAMVYAAKVGRRNRSILHVRVHMCMTAGIP